MPARQAGQARKLLILRGIVIVLGVLLVLSFIALVAGIFVKGAGKRPPAGQQLPETMAMPAGTTIQSMASSRGELAVALRHPDGTHEILVIDTRRGRLLRRIRLAPATAQ